MLKEDLLKTIDADRDELISFLQDFCRVPCPNPPGDTVAAAKVLTDYLSAHSIAHETISPLHNAPNVLSTFPSSDPGREKHDGPHLILNSHIDVFPVSDASHWTHPPWSATISRNRMYARGIVDMKLGTAALVAAYAYLHPHAPSFRGTATLEAVSDEETGGAYGTKFLLHEDPRKELWRGDAVLNAEPSGLQSVRFAEKGTLRMTFFVNTRGAHGAYTHLDEGAVRVAARLIAALVAGVEDCADFEVRDGVVARYMARVEVRDVVEEIMGVGAAQNMLRPTVNIGTIRGGSKVNTVPNECVFEADIRIPVGLTEERVREKIDGILAASFPQARYEVQRAASNAPNACEPDHALARAVAENGEKVLGRRPVAIPSMGGTDCKHFRYLGIPAFSFGVSPAGMAQRDESADLDDYNNLVKVLTCAAWDYLS